MSEQNSADNFLSMLSNPEMLSAVAKLVSSAQSAPSPDKTPLGPEGMSEGDGASPPDMSGILSAALSNPALMAALPKMLSSLSAAMPKTTQAPPPTDVSETDGTTQASAAPDLSGLGALLPALAGGGGGYKKPPKVTDRRSALLLALKPYMSHDKSDMIDTIVRIIEIMSLIK